jgi:microcystin-dependent protein
VAANLPVHTHTVTAVAAVGTEDGPANNIWANSGTELNLFNNASGTPLTFAPAAISAAGGGQPHDNMMPFTTLTFIIATAGIYPSS